MKQALNQQDYRIYLLNTPNCLLEQQNVQGPYASRFAGVVDPFHVTSVQTGQLNSSAIKGIKVEDNMANTFSNKFSFIITA